MEIYIDPYVLPKPQDNFLSVPEVLRQEGPVVFSTVVANLIPTQFIMV